jgi:hypothetical protein
MVSSRSDLTSLSSVVNTHFRSFLVHFFFGFACPIGSVEVISLFFPPAETSLHALCQHLIGHQIRVTKRFLSKLALVIVINRLSAINLSISGFDIKARNLPYNARSFTQITTNLQFATSEVFPQRLSEQSFFFEVS